LRLAVRRPAALGHLSLGEWIAVLAALIVFGTLGWDRPLWDAPSQATLHLLAMGSFAALAFLVARGARTPHTPLDVPLLGLLVLIGMSTILGENLGLAAGALAASMAFAMMLPISLAALARRPSLTALVVTIPTVGLALLTLAQLGLRRFGWYLAGGPGLLPPVRVGGETTLFGSVAVPAFVVLGLLPLTFAVSHPTARRFLQALTIVLWIALAAFSGSRSAWIAGAVSVIAFAAPEVRRIPLRRIGRPTGRQVALLASAGVVCIAVLVFEAPRLTGLSSLLYRERLWGDTLTAWSRSPLFGIGPGTMPYARQAAAAQFPLHQVHSHDVALGLLGDAGLVGLAAAAVLVVVFFWVAGPHRSRTTRGRAAIAVLAGYLVASFFDDLTFLPNFSILVVLLAALALTDAGAVRWRAVRVQTPFLLMCAVAAVGLACVVLARDAAALAYQAGSTAAVEANWRGAMGWYELSETLDRWHPSTPKSLAIAADAAGDEGAARAAAQRATDLNAGDGASWTNLAILCFRARDVDCALEAARRAGGAANAAGPQLINAAMVSNALGDIATADRLYVLALRNNRNVALVTTWPSTLRPGDVADQSADSSAIQLNVVLARAVGHLPIDPQRFASPAVRAFADAIVANRAAAESALIDAQRSEAGDVLTWEISAVLARHWGEDPSRAVAIANVLRGGPTSVPTLSGMTWDVASFRSYPLDQLLIGADHLLPREAWPWSLERFLP
jgi:O-antigen ligase